MQLMAQKTRTYFTQNTQTATFTATIMTTLQISAAKCHFDAKQYVHCATFLKLANCIIPGYIM